jgi:cysteine desulfurase/selenocysteine lyase
LPYKFEAGTPNIADVVAFKTSLDFLQSLTWENIQKQEQELTDYLWQEISQIRFCRNLWPKYFWPTFSDH